MVDKEQLLKPHSHLEVEHFSIDTVRVNKGFLVPFLVTVTMLTSQFGMLYLESSTNRPVDDGDKPQHRHFRDSLQLDRGERLKLHIHAIHDHSTRCSLRRLHCQVPCKLHTS